MKLRESKFKKLHETQLLNIGYIKKISNYKLKSVKKEKSR